MINAVCHEFERTGFFFEQYHGVSGVGRRAHPFTGWTALVILMETHFYF